MPIQANTKANLIAFAEEQDFQVVDSTATRGKECWILSCPHAHHRSFQVRIDALKQHHRKGSRIICRACKNLARVEKFCAKSNVTAEPDERTGKNLLTCNDCELTYIYDGEFYNPFHCYCSLKTRRNEHTFYKALHDHFPGQLAREIVYVDNHKCDIALFHEEESIYIEIDEIGHRYSPKREQDAEWVRKFEENCEDTEY